MKKGKIELATGPMFSGKTEWLISKLANSNGRKSLAIRFILDNRYSLDSISSHNGHNVKAESATNISDIEKLLKTSPVEVLAIDEVQFFEPQLSTLLQELKNDGLEIYSAGLNVDYLASPWETTEKIAKIADDITNLTAICNVCKKKNATITQRINKSNKRVVIGGKDVYEARCFEHYINPELNP